MWADHKNRMSKNWCFASTPRWVPPLQRWLQWPWILRQRQMCLWLGTESGDFDPFSMARMGRKFSWLEVMMRKLMVSTGMVPNDQLLRYQLKIFQIWGRNELIQFCPSYLFGFRLVGRIWGRDYLWLCQIAFQKLMIFIPNLRPSLVKSLMFQWFDSCVDVDNHHFVVG
jgi:hypothetical protein